LPPLLQGAVQRAADGRLVLPVEMRDIDKLREEIREDGRQRDRTIIAALTGFAAVLWLIAGRDPSWPAWIVLVGSCWALRWSRR
jgi:hypothetical protein